MIYDDYIDYARKYVEQYGEKTLVLMEVGSFFEIYAIDNEEEKSGADIYPVCDLLNLQVSRKNKAILENNRANPLMAGFPSHALAKHTQALLASQYTVVLVRQTTPPPNPKREVTEILSPAMQLQPQGGDGNYLMVVQFEPHADAFGKRLMSMGVVGVDVSTGATFAYELAATSKDPNLCIDELIRMYQTYSPKELVLLGESLSRQEIDMVETAMGIKYESNRSIHRLFHLSTKEYARILYQNEVLRRAYPTQSMLDPIDALHMERMDNARVAFVYMIQFGYEHNEAIIRQLHPPTILQYEEACMLEYNSAIQLNVLSSPGSSDKPLLSWLNRCATAFGARRFRERLLQPTRSVELLQMRYNEIDACINAGNYLDIHKHLRNVMDVERMVRKMNVGAFSPMDWPGYDASLRSMREACALHGDVGTCGKLDACIEGYVSLSLEECAKYLLQDIRGNVFRTGAYEELDALVREWRTHWDSLQSLVQYFSDVSDGDATCKLDQNERDGFSLVITKRRWQALQQHLLKDEQISLPCGHIQVAAFVAKPVSASSSSVRVRHPWIDVCSDKIALASGRIQNVVTATYKQFLSEYVATFAPLLTSVIDNIAELDIVITCARNAVEYKYVRPTVKEDDNTAFLRIKGMRHPILERIMDRSDYVPNDIDVGVEGMTGLLLFGINASGKSSLMKAVGLNILMAQAGMFVAGDSIEFSPYSHIFTRISNADNLYKGWSTFTVEMLELKNILHRCDSRSLVLGDELCAGTESVSALAIVTSGIEMLRAKKTSFIFATHLHDLSSLQRVQQMEDICMKHMHVEIDATGKILYDRKLRNGSGNAMYGLEVCKGLGLPSSFLKVAHEVRCEVQGIPVEFQSSEKTRYNGNVMRHECQVCGKMATETHHILPQKSADAQGFIGHMHKNKACNLVNLCEECHQATHHGGLLIHGYVSTSHGRELRFEVRDERQQKHESHGSPIPSRALFETVRYAHGVWWVKPRKVWRVATEFDVRKRVEKCGYNVTQDLSQLEQDLHDPSMPLPK